MILKLSFGSLNVSKKYEEFSHSLTKEINDNILDLKICYSGTKNIEQIIIDDKNPISTFKSLYKFARREKKIIYFNRRM